MCRWRMSSDLCWLGGALYQYVQAIVKKPLARAGDARDVVRSLGREGPLEEGMATHCSILAWRIPWTEEPDGQQSMGSQRVGHDWK